MWKNYIKVALRNLNRHKEYSFLNVLGITVGMVCFIIISQFILFQLSYDRYHENAGRIYRIVRQDLLLGKKTALTPNPMAPELASSLPEITYAVRINDIHRKVIIGSRDLFFKEDHVVLTDPEVFRVFTFPFVKGNPDTALQEKFSIVISEKMAEKYFGNENPVGQTLSFEKKIDFLVTGVMKDIPKNSHFLCDFMIPFDCADDIYWEGFSFDRTQSSLYTYILIKKNTSAEGLEDKLQIFADKFISPVIKEYAPMADQIPGGLDSLKFKLFLQPLTKIHLHSHLSSELSANYDIRYIYIFFAIALLVLILACFNFINLSTAFSIRRSKEIGLRKVLGARRKQLVNQFVVEAVVFTFAALILALVITGLTHPLIASVLGHRLSTGTVHPILFMIFLFLICLGVGLASGSYPSFIISAFQPVKSLKGSLPLRSKNAFRNFFVLAQFVITTGLIFCTLVISDQLRFIQNKKLGFQKEFIIVLPLENRNEVQKYQLIKDNLQKNPHITGITGSSNVLSRIYSSSPFWWETAKDNESMRVEKLFVDFDFIDSMGVKLIAGRNFSKDQRTDEKYAYIINRAAAKAFGWESPIGKRLAFAHRKDETGSVIGVIENFHFRSLHSQIQPLLLLPRRNAHNYIYVRMDPKHITDVLSSIKATWKEIFPLSPMEYFFLDDDINKMYQAEAAMGKLFKVFSGMAIFIACLGLFGLISFAAEQRAKEISIRKVLGASVSRVVTLFIKKYLILVAAANSIAWPIAHIIMNRWLVNFTYRTHINPFIYIESGVIVLFIALLTLSLKSIKAAQANPIDNLKYE